tara:strand:+ start:167706 stop:169880 length:2175 start_codon:yes stop_codon:yes gene_type:complete
MTTTVAKNKTKLLGKLRKYSIYSVILSFLLLIAVILYISPKLIETKNFKELVEKSVSASLGLAVKAEVISFSIITGPQVALTNVVVSRKKSTVFTAKKMYAKASFVDLLFGSIKIKKLLLDYPQISLIKGEDGLIRLPLLGQENQNATDITALATAAIASLDFVSMRGGSINWIDRSVQEEPISLKLSNCTLKFNRDKDSENLTTTISGVIDVGANRADFKGNMIIALEEITVPSLTLQFGQSYFQLSGKLKNYLTGKPEVDAKLSSNVNMSDLVSYTTFFDDVEEEGFLTSTVWAKQNSKSKEFRVNGSILFHDTTFKLPIFHGIFEKCNGSFEFEDNRISIKNGKGKFGGSPFNLTGEVLLGKQNKYTLNVMSENLALKDIFGPPPAIDKLVVDVRKNLTGQILQAKEKKSALATSVENGNENGDLISHNGNSIMGGDWNIEISSKQGSFGRLKYQDLDSRILYKKNRYHIEPFTFNALGGRWSWIANIEKIPKSSRIESSIEISEMNLSKYFEEITLSKPVVTGTLDLIGNVSGNGLRWNEIKKTLDGHIEARTGKGVFHRFPVLSKIFALLNISQYFKLRTPDLSADGMPFDSVTATISILKGLASTENLDVRSEAMRISGVGDYHVASSLVDMKIGIMPFITIDRVISSVPVVGEVLTGENKSLITSYYLVKGAAKNPEVTAIPVESIGIGIFSIIQRILELPVTIIDKAIDRIKQNGN